MRVLSLKELTECKMLVVFLLKRIDIIVHLQLETDEMREHPQKYEPKEKYQNMFDCLRHNQLKNIEFQCAGIKSNEIIKRKFIRNMTYDINLKVQKIFDLAMELPPMYTLTLLQKSDEYQSMPAYLFNKWYSMHKMF